MESEKHSVNKVVLDHKVVKRIFERLIDVHGFGDWRIFLDNEPIAEPSLSYNPKSTPPWIIHREDLKAINALHKRLVAEIAAADVLAESSENSKGFLIFLGGCIVSKVILLIHCLLLTYNYYKVKTLPYPGRTASSYLNPEIVPDLKEALALTDYVLFAHREQHPICARRFSATSTPR